MGRTEQFEAERARLVRVAAGILGDRDEAEDVVQRAWMRLHAFDGDIASVPAWLTTVTTRLCLDRLRVRMPDLVESVDDEDIPGVGVDPAAEAELADTVGVALHIVLERLTPSERVSFVLHDTFGVEFDTIAQALEGTPAAARKLASRARRKVSTLAPSGPPADREVVDAFLEAARGGEFARLLHVLAPDVTVSADAAAAALGSPTRIDGHAEVATFFDRAASAAFPVLLAGRPAAAWIHRGVPRVAFDITVAAGRITSIVFRADPAALARIERVPGGRREPRPTQTSTEEPTDRKDHPHEDHDLPSVGRTMRHRPPRCERRRRHQGPGPAPQGRRRGRGLGPPGGGRRDERTLEEPPQGNGLVPRRQEAVRRTARGLTAGEPEATGSTARSRSARASPPVVCLDVGLALRAARDDAMAARSGVLEEADGVLQFRHLSRQSCQSLRNDGFTSVAVPVRQQADLGQRQPGPLQTEHQTSLIDGVGCVPAVPGSGPRRHEDADVLPMAQHVRFDADLCSASPMPTSATTVTQTPP